MQRETVWLVEDEQGIADTLVYMLQQEGFAVEVFERGLPVLDKARKQVSITMGQNRIDQTVFHRFRGGKEAIALGITFNLF